MKKNQFNELLKKYKPEEIIRKYHECKIYLTSSQLRKAIELKNVK